MLKFQSQSNSLGQVIDAHVDQVTSFVTLNASVLVRPALLYQVIDLDHGEVDVDELIVYVSQ
jgi:hypothetical protein